MTNQPHPHPHQPPSTFECDPNSWNNYLGPNFLLSHTNNNSHNDGGNVGGGDGRVPAAASRIRQDDSRVFGGTANPLMEELVLVQCRYCRRTVLPTAFSEHLARCQTSRSRNSSNSSLHQPDRDLEQPLPTTSEPRPKSRAKSQNRYKQDLPQKYPQFRHLEPTRKKQSLVDLDIQCGVIGASGSPCTRPLSCHLHSTFEKSQVGGRSADILTLLNRYYEQVSFGQGSRSKKAETIDHSTETVKTRTLDKLDALMEDACRVIQTKCLPPLVRSSFVSIRRKVVSMRTRDVIFGILHHGTQRQFNHTNPTQMQPGMSNPAIKGPFAMPSVAAGPPTQHNAMKKNVNGQNGAVPPTTVPNKNPSKRRKSDVTQPSPRKKPNKYTATNKKSSDGETAAMVQQPGKMAQNPMHAGMKNVQPGGMSPESSKIVDPRDLKFM